MNATEGTGPGVPPPVLTEALALDRASRASLAARLFLSLEETRSATEPILTGDSAELERRAVAIESGGEPTFSREQFDEQVRGILRRARADRGGATG